MRPNIILSVFCAIAALSINAQTQIGQTLTQFELGDGFGSSVSMNNNGTRLMTSAPRFDTDGVAFSGRVDIYEFDGVNWVLLGETLDGGTPVEFGLYGIGLEMSRSGNRIAIGGNTTKAQAYEWNAGSQQWEQMGDDLEFPGSPAGSLSRFRFSADENTLVVGGSNAGLDTVYVFEWDGTNWTAVGNPLEEPARNEIAASGDAQTIVNRYDEFNVETGITIYNFNGTDWTQEFSREFNPDVFASDGFDLSASGNRLVMSYWDEDTGTGTFETYDKVGGAWQASLDSFTIPCESFNNALRLSDNGRIFIYGGGTENVAGNAADGTRVYQQVGNEWNLVNFFDYPNYDESIKGNVAITGDGKKVAFGQAIPFDVGFIQVYDLSDVLSVEDVDSDVLRVYPNPTTGTLNIDVSNSEEIQRITVLDITGKIIQRIEFDTATQPSIELNGPAGMYLVNIATLDGQKTYKVIKQ